MCCSWLGGSRDARSKHYRQVSSDIKSPAPKRRGRRSLLVDAVEQFPGQGDGVVLDIEAVFHDPVHV